LPVELSDRREMATTYRQPASQQVVDDVIPGQSGCADYKSSLTEGRSLGGCKLAV